MSTQEIQDYKINWLRSKCFRVNVSAVEEEHLEWLTKNLDEKVWEKSLHTIFFENANDASNFREHFQNDSRTVDIS